MAKSIIKDPGIVLKSFLSEYQLNPSRLAMAVELSQSTIRQITLNKMKISIPIALRFAKFFGNPAEFWLDLQKEYSLAEAAKDPELNGILKNIQRAAKPTVKKIEPKPVSGKNNSAVKKSGTAKTARPASRKK